MLLDIFHNDEKLRRFQDLPDNPRGGSSGSGWGMPPPGPVKVSYKKDGHQRWLHRFSCFSPPSPGHWISYRVETPTQINVWLICHQNCMKMKKHWLNGDVYPSSRLKKGQRFRGSILTGVTFCLLVFTY